MFMHVIRSVVSADALTILINLCPDEEKWCSARDLLIIESCRAEKLLSNDLKYVMIG